MTGSCIRGMCWSKPIACCATNGSVTRFSPRTRCRKLDWRRQEPGATSRDPTRDLLAEPSRQGTGAHRCTAEDWRSDGVWTRRVDAEFLLLSGFEVEVAPRASHAVAAQVPADIPVRFTARPTAPPRSRLRATRALIRRGTGRHRHLDRPTPMETIGRHRPSGFGRGNRGGTRPPRTWRFHRPVRR